MKIVWLLYQQEDLSANRDYARLMRENGLKRDMKIETVLTRDLTLLLDENGTPSCLRKGRKERPDAVIARMREPLYSRHFERMDVPVFNGSEVCRICNDKRQTLQFLSGLPMPRTTFLTPFTPMPQDGPVIVKPACSHGGDRVLFGQIVAGVMRTAKSGVVSNYKRGGNVALHDLSREERQLAEEVIARFDAAGAPLCFAGVDLLYEDYGPVVGEVEDVVGSRMLYRVSDLDVVGLYLDEIRRRI